VYASILPLSSAILPLEGVSDEGPKTVITSADQRMAVREFGQSAVRRPECVLHYNGQYINDLPITSPHGSDLYCIKEILDLRLI